MRTQLECYPCLVRQTLDILRISKASEEKQQRVMQAVLGELAIFDPRRSPPEMAYRIHQIVCRETGNRDPYLAAKRQSTREALTWYAELKAKVAEAADPLETAVRISIAGNIIDAAISLEYDLQQTLKRVLTQPFAIEVFDQFKNALAKARQIVFLADNAGETVFDRVLIETLGKPVTYVVKGGPILNDATAADARAAGIEKVATVIDNGSDAPGTILDFCSAGFRHLLAHAELVIAKGQANYETFGGIGAPVFLLLQVKCPVVARDLGVPVTSIVFTQR